MDITEATDAIETRRQNAAPRNEPASIQRILPTSRSSRCEAYTTESRIAEDIRAVEAEREAARVRGLWKRCGIPERHGKRVLELATLNDDSAWCRVRDKLTAVAGTGFLIVLHGKRGTGKTQLAAGLCYAAGQRGMPARYAKAAQVFGDIRDAMAEGRADGRVVDDFAGDRKMHETGAHGLLVIDEIHERGNSQFEDRTLRQIIDRRYDAQLDTLLVTNESPAQCAESLGPSITDRVRECGGFIELNGPSFRAGGVA